ncbi:hypothetical protein C8R43DRAFT_897457 [Mycena crocata]|nr:hypothetical protein C8R43DRAFT_897457 [Mycena crocata]
MLFLLFLVHAVYTNGHPVTGDPLISRAPADSCDDINNCRKLFDIIWGCLATIFACTWVSVHPNVPPPNQSQVTLFWRRLKLMLIAIIAPEIMVGFAARQWLAARSFSRDFNISRTHGFFISMGGFVSRGRHNPIVTDEQLQEHLNFIADIRAVEEEDIKDKSKGDALSKGVALIQGLWFTAQCLARIHQHLPISELEVTTLAFAVVNIFIYALWWSKPLDVQRPIRVGPAEEVPAVEPYRNDPSSVPLGAKPQAEETKPWQGSPSDGLSGALDGNYGNTYDPTSYISVPSFWSAQGARNKYMQSFYIECLVGAIFGAIHCGAWNVDFPSNQEMWIWRSTALAVATIPAIMAGVGVGRWNLVKNQSVWDGLLFIPFILAIFGYPAARLFLIILPLIALRAPPSGALMDVDWSAYIPHL